MQVIFVVQVLLQKLSMAWYRIYFLRSLSSIYQYPAVLWLLQLQPPASMKTQTGDLNLFGKTLSYYSGIYNHWVW